MKYQLIAFLSEHRGTDEAEKEIRGFMLSDPQNTDYGNWLVDLYLIGQSLSHFRREKCGSGEVNRSLLNGKLITVAANNYIALAKITDKPLCYRVQNTIARDCGLCMSLTVTLLLASTRMIGPEIGRLAAKHQLKYRRSETRSASERCQGMTKEVQAPKPTKSTNAARVDTKVNMNMETHPKSPLNLQVQVPAKKMTYTAPC